MSLIPFDQRDGQIWFNGKLIPWGSATVHICTHGLHYGTAVFEGERVYDNVVFKSREHTERLFRSAELMGMTIPFTVDEIEAAKQQTVAAHGYANAYVRPVAWRGSEMMGISAQLNKINVAIAVWQWPSYFDPEQRLRGIKLDISQWKRPSPETAPSSAKAAGLYMICTLSKHAAEAKGLADALMMDYRGHVAEATGANVLFVKDGQIHTPTPDCFLDGITRREVVGMAGARGINVIERTIMPNELESFEQCFLTGTAAEVTPVSQIGPYTFEVGDIARALMNDYDGVVRQKLAA